MKRERGKRREKVVLLSIRQISNGVDYFTLFGLLVDHHIKLTIASMNSVVKHMGTSVL